MNTDEAIQKAIKLLRLARSDKPGEAAAAAAAAQAIMDRYKLGQLSLDSVVDDEVITDHGIFAGNTDGRKSTWRTRLAVSVAYVNQCKVYAMGGAICLIGRPSDVQIVRTLYAWLEKEVDRLARRDAAGLGRVYANNYRIGVVDTVAERLAAQARDTANQMRSEAATTGGDALVRIENAIVKLDERRDAVQRWTKENMNLRRARASNYTQDQWARLDGRAAGHEVRLRANRAQIEA